MLYKNSKPMRIDKYGKITGTKTNWDILYVQNIIGIKIYAMRILE